LYETNIDKSTIEALPTDVDIRWISGIDARSSRRVGLGDIGLRTLLTGWREARRVCREVKIDAVLAVTPPAITMLIPWMLNVEFGLPFVVDYGDPWFSRYQSREGRTGKAVLAKALALLIEPRVLRRAAGLTAVSLSTFDYITREFPELQTVRRIEIPFGFDVDDCGDRDSGRNPIFHPDDGQVHISYVGAIAHHMIRPAEQILAAIAAARASIPELFTSVRFHFVGSDYAPAGLEKPRLTCAIHRAGLSDMVSEVPRRVTNSEAAAILRDSQGLLVVGGTQSHYSSSKVYQYLLTGLPLLVFGNVRSSMTDIARGAGADVVISFDGENLLEARSDLVAGLTTLVKLARARTRRGVPPAILNEYSTLQMTQRLVSLLDSVADDG
jgi:hypothetical protein